MDTPLICGLTQLLNADFFLLQPKRAWEAFLVPWKRQVNLGEYLHQLNKYIGIMKHIEYVYVFM